MEWWQNAGLWVWAGILACIAVIWVQNHWPHP
ncbi:hypothetical protein SEA_SAVAGE2526_60 [Arthrobacter phage Savage2526]|uniref:Uncharacterized protein n=3 Tax=Korravirus glenn TaxID=1982079 RepID=A0A2H4P9M5_9CAUD|nr:hypothetical protein PHIRE_FLUKE_61 [Arthrobacter phage Fluke]AZS09812.1 hypothetical protein SEA_ROZBY_59 [Arthrobacter phage Rozby]AZS10175.1 hypothetical protein SEA_SAVAGE2526_60 [Arthrobacter phage Savage2526]WAB10109.1 membrane protein [Arthrobacter phage Jumboset]